MYICFRDISFPNSEKRMKKNFFCLDLVLQIGYR